jgi:D-alanyl-lipoteichoic acid acyltransferase DltB (MBOAT superfamily)
MTETADTDTSSAATVPVTEAGKMEQSGLLSRLKYNPQQSFIFTTPVFWIFFLVVMAGFVVLRKRRQMCHTWLLIVSLYFYYKAGGLFVSLLLFTSAITYFTALFTGRATGKRKKRFWLTVNIVVLLGLLSYFKYAGFFTESLNAPHSGPMISFRRCQTHCLAPPSTFHR